MSYVANRDRSPLTLDQIRRHVPSVFAEGKQGDLSNRYAFISTAEVINLLGDEGFVPVSARDSRVVAEEKRGFTKHEVRFRRAADTGRQFAVGDVFPEVLLTNSHDGSSAYRFEGGLYRLVCANGMCLPESGVTRVSVRHTGNIEAEVIDGCISVVDEAADFAERTQAWRHIHLNPGEREAFAVAAADLRWDRNEEGLLQAPIRPSSLLQARRYNDTGDDLFHVFNRVQENLVRGGQRGRNPNTLRRASVREVTGIDQSNKLNRALTSLAVEMARLKGGE